LLQALLVVVDVRELSSLCNCASITVGSSPGKEWPSTSLQGTDSAMEPEQEAMNDLLQ